MRERMGNPAMTVPGAMDGLVAVSTAARGGGVPPRTLDMVHLRASQINGCGYCVDMHARDLRRGGETDARVFAVAAWRDTTYFTDAERAALVLTEAVTRLSDRPDAVPDDIWAEAARHYDQAALSALVLSIAMINLWNRLNVTTRQMAGAVSHGG
ncbi:MAG: carboxymuconolactone decarboxylase family protein [Chloroflexota bacterium]|nr:carboxymuconolactone decarboxylase family protein [Chloroflexota bacterium]